jgi:hypothetical protein
MIAPRVPPNAPVRPMCIVTLDHMNAERTFDILKIYSSAVHLYATPRVHMSILEMERDCTMLIKAVEATELNTDTIEALRNAEPMKVTVFTDKKTRAEYTYVLCRKITADMSSD